MTKSSYHTSLTRTFPVVQLPSSSDSSSTVQRAPTRHATARTSFRNGKGIKVSRPRSGEFVRCTDRQGIKHTKRKYNSSESSNESSETETDSDSDSAMSSISSKQLFILGTELTVPNSSQLNRKTHGKGLSYKDRIMKRWAVSKAKRRNSSKPDLSRDNKISSDSKRKSGSRKPIKLEAPQKKTGKKTSTANKSTRRYSGKGSTPAIQKSEAPKESQRWRPFKRKSLFARQRKAPQNCEKEAVTNSMRKLDFRKGAMSGVGQSPMSLTIDRHEETNRLVQKGGTCSAASTHANRYPGVLKHSKNIESDQKVVSMEGHEITLEEHLESAKPGQVKKSVFFLPIPIMKPLRDRESRQAPPESEKDADASSPSQGHDFGNLKYIRKKVKKTSMFFPTRSRSSKKTETVDTVDVSPDSSQIRDTRDDIDTVDIDTVDMYTVDTDRGICPSSSTDSVRPSRAGQTASECKTAIQNGSILDRLTCNNASSENQASIAKASRRRSFEGHPRKVLDTSCNYHSRSFNKCLLKQNKKIIQDNEVQLDSNAILSLMEEKKKFDALIQKIERNKFGEPLIQVNSRTRNEHKSDLKANCKQPWDLADERRVLEKMNALVQKRLKAIELLEEEPARAPVCCVPRPNCLGGV